MSINATTPYSELLDAGIYTIDFPPTWTVGANTYQFSRWADDNSTNPSRQVDLTAGPVSLFAVYALPRQLLSIGASPEINIGFTLTKTG